MRYPTIFAIAVLTIALAAGTFGFFSDSYCLVPRESKFFLSVLVHPLIHADLNHLIGNLTFIVPCLFIFYKLERPLAIKLFAIIYLAQGSLLWVTGHNGIHFGCSGVGFGIGFYLLGISIFSMDIKRLAIGLLLLLTFYATFANFMLEMEGIADDSHVCGTITGLFTAYFRNRPFFSRSIQ
jgi:membrane associated rhomboid family serine protease